MSNHYYQSDLRAKELRTILYTMAVIYPCWIPIVRTVQPDAIDSWTGRLSITLICLIPCFLSYHWAYIRLRMEFFYTLGTISLMLHLIYLSDLNHLSYLYAFGSFLGYFALTIGYLQTRYFFTYFLSCLIFAAWRVDGENAIVSKVLYLAILGSSGILSYLNYRDKNKIYDSLTQSEMRLKNMVENLPVGSVYIENNVIEMNRAAKAIFGSDLFEVQTTVELLRRLKVSPESLQLYIDDRKKQFPHTRRLSIENNDGKKRELEFAAFKDQKCEIWILNDETDKIKAQANMVYASKMASLGEMAGGIAHEINNPLTVILGNLKIVRKQISETIEKVPDDLEQKFNKMEAMIERIVKIIKSMRSFSRDGANDDFTDVKCEHLIETSLGLCSEKIQKMGITLTIECPKDLSIYMQEVQISQVLVNLLNNAMDEVTKLETKWIKILVEKVSTGFEIRIIDSGSGVGDDVVDKIFLPFFTTKPVGAGTGLGLSIAKKIMDEHGGVLRYELFQGHTSFVVYLPFKKLRKD